MVFQETITVRTRGQGLWEITGEVERLVREAGVRRGLAQVFCQHTSCSLMIMENADPTARADLAAWLNRLVPENDPHFEHTAEGPDDMPSHIKMALTRPIDWQIACKRGSIKALAEGAQKEALKAVKRAKASVRAFVEHPFHIVKNLFQYRKTRYRGLAKNCY